MLSTNPDSGNPAVSGDVEPPTTHITAAFVT